MGNRETPWLLPLGCDAGGCRWGQEESERRGKEGIEASWENRVSAQSPGGNRQRDPLHAGDERIVWVAAKHKIHQSCSTENKPSGSARFLLETGKGPVGARVPLYKPFYNNQRRFCSRYLRSCLWEIQLSRDSRPSWCFGHVLQEKHGAAPVELRLGEGLARLVAEGVSAAGRRSSALQPSCASRDFSLAVRRWKLDHSGSTMRQTPRACFDERSRCWQVTREE